MNHLMRHELHQFAQGLRATADKLEQVKNTNDLCDVIWYVSLVKGMLIFMRKEAHNRLVLFAAGKEF